MMHGPAGSRPQIVDSIYAWRRLGVTLIFAALGSVGLWSYVISLPAVQAELGLTRADAAMPYTIAMVGFAAGNVYLGRLADRLGVMAPMALGTACTVSYTHLTLPTKA